MGSSMTIGKRFFVASGVLLLMSAILTLVAWFGFSGAEQGVRKLAGDAIPGIVYASAIRGDVNSINGSMLRHMHESNPAEMQKTESEIADTKRKLTEDMKSYEDCSKQPDDREQIAKLQAHLDAILQGWEKVLPSSRAGKEEIAFPMYKAEIMPHITAVRDQLESIVGTNKSDADTATASTEHTIQLSMWTSVLLGVFSLVVGIGVSWFMINGLNAQMSTIVAELADGSEQIASAAGQVSSSSQSLAQGSSEQAASLQDTSASSEEINSMARKNSDNARQMAGLVGKSQDMFVRTNEQLEEMVVSMDEINESSGKISKIIKVIDEIAFQTNILALNAAVEAARAGEAGMGFAVVADEVRNLAQRSAQAAKDTAMLIEESISKSNGGKMKVDQVATAIRDITRDSASVKTLVDEVTLGSEEQSRGLQQISKSIMQMEQVTQTTAATAEESAAAAEELNAQSESLKDIVGNLSAMLGGGGGQPVRSSRSHSKVKHTSSTSTTNTGAFGASKPSASSASSRRSSNEDMGAFPLEAAFKEF